jgi:hypothetical protein
MFGGIEVQLERLRALTTVTLKLFLFPICRENIYIYIYINYKNGLAAAFVP